jgi:threonyl-tRNA synthetase
VKQKVKTEKKKQKKKTLSRVERMSSAAASGSGIVLPDFVQARIAVWDRLKASKAAAAASSSAEKKSITVTLPDGKQLAGVAGETTPLQIAEQISSGLARAVLVAQVNDKLWDLTRPLEADCQLALLKFESDDAAKNVFWHSSAHILGQALEIAFAGQLCIGPPLDNGGFYYDIATAAAIHADDFDRVQKLVASIVKDNQPFERMVLTKAEALELFAANKYKLEIITKKIGDAETTTAYRCGPLIDLCRGPHISTTKKVEAFKLTKNSSAYWLGNAANDSLQRVYGISFPTKKLLKEWEDFQEKAAQRDHRVIGRQQDLFFFDPLSPGSAFWLPHGARIYSKLIEFMRGQYHKRGFTEVITPNIYNHELWRISGHLENYAENIFSFKTREGEDYALKPMNCVRESDHQILTNRGFMFLDEVERAVERDAAGHVVDWRGLAVANYDRAAQRLVYEQPRALVVKPAGADRMIEFSSANGEFHVVVTEGHDMFVGDAGGSPASFRKVPAKQLLAELAELGDAPLAVSLLCGAPAGRSMDLGVPSENTLTTQLKRFPVEDARALKAAFAAVRTQMMPSTVAEQLDSIPLGDDAPCIGEPYAGDMNAPWVVALALKSRIEVTAFLELVGFWIGDGTLTPNWPLPCPAFTLKKIVDIRFIVDRLVLLGHARHAKIYKRSNGTVLVYWVHPLVCEFFATEYAAKYAAVDWPAAKMPTLKLQEQALASKSAKWFPEFVWSLPAASQERIIVGLHLADGSFAAKDNVIYTSSVHFRDELVELLSDCGYSPTFSLKFDTSDDRGIAVATQPGWQVRWRASVIHSVQLVGGGSPASSAAAVRVREVQCDGSRSWCFDMADGFIVTRRAERVSAAHFASGGFSVAAARAAADDGAVGATEWIVLSASRATIQGNCPGHCLMFKQTVRSYRDLPIRFADFGVLHRNEITGALGGLTRVRRFQQDDAHIFCMPSQVQSEVAGCIEFIEAVYGLFNFKFEIALSTRPANFIGEVAVWDKAEEALKQVLDDFSKRTGKAWKLNPGDGAFYGPKLDIQVKDALNRPHQCATIQLDFQLPLRFELKYVASEGTALPPPVIIHRAIFGSLERFTGILMEHTGGRWPLWLSPRQVCIVPVAHKIEPFAEQVRQRLHDEGFYVDVHGGEKTMNKRIAEASKQQYNYIVVVGDKEVETDSVNVRPRPKRDQEHVPTVVKTIAQFIDELKQEAREYRVPADQDWISDDNDAPTSAALPSGKSSVAAPVAAADGMDF